MLRWGGGSTGTGIFMSYVMIEQISCAATSRLVCVQSRLIIMAQRFDIRV